MQSEDPTSTLSCSDRSDSLQGPLADSPHRVLVTGGAGFIGYHTCVALLRRGDLVSVVDDLNDYYSPVLKRANIRSLQALSPMFELFEGDIADEAFMQQVFERTRPTLVIHLAARAGVRPSLENPFLYVRTNVHGTTVVLEMCRRFACPKLVYASSSSVYGGSTAASFIETDTVDCPVSPYAATKKSCELLAHTYHHLHGMDCIGLRFFTVYGPRGRPDMAPFKFMDRIARGETIEQYGDGSSSRDYTYVGDIVSGVLLAADRASGCEVFNLGNGAPVLLSAFIEALEETLGQRAFVRVVGRQPGDVERTCADISKARRMLGYAPSTDFREGLRKTVQWYREEYCVQDSPPPSPRMVMSDSRGGTLPSLGQVKLQISEGMHKKVACVGARDRLPTSKKHALLEPPFCI
jgi:UDP-glucuronate 4-epimerase